MDFEVLAVDDDAFHEKAEDRLLGVEISVEELGRQGGHEFLSVLNSALRELELHAPGLEFQESELGRDTVSFDGMDASTEQVQREGADLIGIGEAVTLPCQLLESRFGLLDSQRLVGRSRGRLLRPRRQLSGQGVRVEQEIANGGPNRLVDAGGPQPIIGAAPVDAVPERSVAPAAEIVVVDVLPAGVSRSARPASNVGSSAHSAFQ